MGGAQGDLRQVDKEIRSLTAAVLEIDQDARSIEEQGRSPDDDVLIVYVGSRAKDLQLRGVSVQIDRATPIYHQYSDQQSNSLQSGMALHRLVEMPLVPGSHRLRVEFVADEVGAKLNTSSLRTSIDRSFQKQGTAALIELDLVQEGLFNKPAVTLREWSQGQ
jgi:hypothetical protein